MMRQDEELWMKKMKESLKDYSEPPASDSWSKLEKELSPVVEKRIRPYIWWMAAATLLLAVSGISLFLMQTPTADDIRHTMPPTLAITPDVMPETKEPDVLITQVKPEEKSVVTYKRSGPLLGTKGIEKKLETEVVTDHDITKQVNDEHHVIAENVSENFSENEVLQSDTQSDDRRMTKPSGKDKLHLPVVSEKKHSSDGKWSVAASFSNVPNTSSAETVDFLAMTDMMQSSGLPSNVVSINEKNELVFDNGLPYLKQTATISEIKHKQPISFGLSARKNLSKGLSVESGVTYTMLSSDGKSVDNPSEKIEQKLHYIGIPIRGNWDFVNSKRFTVYLTAGGMIEKCIYGKIGSERHTVKPLQFSLAGGVGGQLNISKRIGIYVEPGVSYYFDDGSDVETIRKENPFNFNLQGGIRFTY